MKLMNHVARAIAAAVMFLMLPAGAFAAYPDRPIHFIVPYPPGAGTDITARLLAQKLTTALKQTIVVYNKPGANAVIGMQAVASAAPDGYTIGLMTDAHSINEVLRKDKLPYDSIRDFEPISLLVTSPFVLVVNPRLGVHSLAEFVAKARQSPRQLSYASSGEGSPHHLAMEWFKALAGIDLVHVPYQGGAPALVDLMSGQVSAMFTGVNAAMPHVRQGKLQALAVAPAKGVPSEKELPSVAQSGYPTFDFLSWFGLVAPRGTPPEVLDRLNLEVRKILSQPEFEKRIAELGMFPVDSSRQEFRAFLPKDFAKYREIVRKANLQVQ